MSKFALSLSSIFFLCCATCHADDFIWVEGENSKSNRMRDNGWYNSVRTTELSGGAWLSHFGGGEIPVATYEVEADVAGEYELWLRANPIAAKISVRLNDGDWQAVSVKDHEQNINIAGDGKPDLRFVAWIKAGKRSLKAGVNEMQIRFESKNNFHGGLDCFVLSRSPFLPQGNRKPGQKAWAGRSRYVGL